MHGVMGELYGKGALILHGEQEFTYHRPIVVGDVLAGEGKVIDIYERETDNAVMTFVVVETEWKDDRTNEPVVTERFNLIGRTRKG
jgi:acyl dehydratase